MVASLVGGAILLFSCSGKKTGTEVNLETMITQQSDTLTMVNSKNGTKEYRFWTPLMERYEFARSPYMEFRYGINIITFDSLGAEASKLRADYAIFYENRELWETRGNVVGTGADGRQLFTQQLFWDQKTDKVYSNVDCKIVDGGDVFVGEGFESDSEFKEWVFRESEGRMWVDASQGEPTEQSSDNDTRYLPDTQEEMDRQHPNTTQEHRPNVTEEQKPAPRNETRLKAPDRGERLNVVEEDERAGRADRRGRQRPLRPTKRVNEQ